MALPFVLNEYIYSETAKTYNINNFPGADVFESEDFSYEKIISNLEKLHNNVIDPLRLEFGPHTNNADKMIKINSAYRCTALNSFVNGASNSQHKYGLAVDIQSPKHRSSLIWNWCFQNLDYHQLIWEFPERGDRVDGAGARSWVHISYVEGNNKKINTIATQREDLHQMYESESTTRKPNSIYNSGIKIADQTLL